jgi:flagellar protein FlgJ
MSDPAIPAVGAVSPAANGAPAGDPKLAKVARQFEAIFVRQMLKSARAANFGDGLFSDKGLQTFREMQDDRFAQIAADKGSFGLGKMIEKQLTAQAARTAPVSAPASTPASTPTPVSKGA